jgi:ADP-ribose pyrophosphatase YjhB (NUDIX family)
MYKVFNQSQQIFFTSNKEEINKDAGKSIIYQNNNDLLVLDPFETLQQTSDIALLSSKPVKAFHAAFKNFKKIDACGGLIVKGEELLMIKRLGKWDLPKGKLEKNESLKECAIRECQEECGIGELIIKKELPSTYHIYQHPKKDKVVLKRSYWYLMETIGESDLSPQEEEGIEWVGFVPFAEIAEKMNNSYKNIELCLKNSGLLR